MQKDVLKETVEKIFANDKGLLAADESNGTANKRLASLGIAETEEMRREWRQLLFETPGLNDYISGVILFDETIRQKNNQGEMFKDYLAQKGILAGIKVDEGLAHMVGSASTDEHITVGLNGLPARLQEYKSMGASFAKWRAAFKVGPNMPSDEAIKQNVEILTKYAHDCQEAGIVPIIEPEVLIDGTHTLEESKVAHEKVLTALFESLKTHFIFLPGLILKTSMVHEGKENENKSTDDKIAEATAEVLRKTVPEEVGGVVFLSGGQSPDEATVNLDAIEDLGPYPWPISYSYSRAVQNNAQSTWSGKKENIEKAQEVFLKRLKLVNAAGEGELEKIEND